MAEEEQPKGRIVHDANAFVQKTYIQRVRKPGRPPLKSTRKDYIDEYTEYVVSSLEREIGKSVEDITRDEFEETLRNLAREKGWVIK